MENNSKNYQEYIRLYTLVYTPIALFFIAIIFLVFWFGKPAIVVINDEHKVAMESSRVSTSSQSVMVVATTTIVVVGDESALGVEGAVGYPKLLEIALNEAGYPARVVVSANNGATSRSAYDGIDKILSMNPDIVVVAIGSNDFGSGIDLSATQNHIAGILDTLRLSQVKVLLVGMPTTKNVGDAYRTQLRALYAKLANEFHVPFLPLLSENVHTRDDESSPAVPRFDNEGAMLVAEQNILPKIISILK